MLRRFRTQSDGLLGVPFAAGTFLATADRDELEWGSVFGTERG